MEKRDEIKQGYDDLKKELAEFTGSCYNVTLFLPEPFM